MAENGGWGGGWVSDSGTGRRLPVPDIIGDEWENGSTRGKIPMSRTQRKPDYWKLKNNPTTGNSRGRNSSSHHR